MDVKTNLTILLIASLGFHLLLVGDGLFTVDEREYLYLTKALAEKRTLDVSSYIPGYASMGSELLLPFGFFKCNPGVCVEPSFGFPLIASLFYPFLKDYALVLVNIVFATLSVLLVYLISKKIWGSDEVALISAALFLFATDSMFYAVSLWYHTLIVTSFLLSSYAILSYSSERRRFLLLFVISSAFCIWIAYYMFVPLFVMYLYLLMKVTNRGRLALLLSLCCILLISFAYNYWVYSSPIFANFKPTAKLKGVADDFRITDTPSTIALNIERVSYGFVGMFISRFFTFQRYPTWSNFQRAVLEYCPYLILTIPGIIILMKHKTIDWGISIIIVSNLVYSFMILYGRTGDFGGWQLSMRNLTPVLPLLVVLSSGFIYRFLKLKHVATVVLLSLVISYLLPAMLFDATYYIASTLSVSLAFFTVFLLLLYALGVHHFENLVSSLITITLIAMLLLAVVINTNDVKIGREFRSFTNKISEHILENTEDDSIILYPRSFPLDVAETPARIRVWYEPKVFLNSKDYLNQTYVDEINDTIYPLIGKHKLYLVIPPEGINGSLGLMDAFAWDGVINISTTLSDSK